MIKAIIFDLDGVLIDATVWHYIAFNRALAIFGYTITPDEHKDVYNGLPTREKLKKLTKDKGLPESLHKIIHDTKQVYTTQVIERLCRPDFNKISMLMKLKDKGYRLAICSNAVRATVDNTLKRAGLYEYFEVVLSNEDVTIAKPDPQIYFKVFERLRLEPRECVAIEDSEHGKKAAVSSGAALLEVGGYNDVNYDLVNNFLKSMKEGR